MTDEKTHPQQPPTGPPPPRDPTKTEWRGWRDKKPSPKPPDLDHKRRV